MDVGVRELKAKLSDHLERVAKGEVITVTSRGRRIAQIIPIAGSDNVERGLREGWLHRKVDRPPESFVPFKPRPETPTTTEIISMDRDE